jgi:hypothetical protein
MTTQPSRHYLRWNVNEVLRLQREYELLEMSVADIAKIHNRSVNAIVCKLVSEGFVDRWEDARGYAQSELIQEAIKNGDLVFESCMDSCSEASFDEDDADDEDYQDEGVEEDDDDEDYVDEAYSESLVARLQQRVAQLEGMVSAMKRPKTTPKRKPLRSYLVR